MADLAQIIAGIDGYRNYENNRALDLANRSLNIQNQAAQIKNQEMMTINDLKNQIAGLSNNPYAKLNAWDPVTRGRQLLNEDQQLKIASKWASSIKNLAPEKRAQGYAQFLRAMPGLGIDVSDMPQAYDEAFVNQMADLGIETETRYQNEQTNMRQDKQLAATRENLERQIAANREAREDEFNKKLAAFDYENNYRTQAEKDKQAQIDAMIDASSLSPDDKEQAKLASRNIKLPTYKAPEERLMETFMNPASTDEQRQAAREGLKQYAALRQEIKDLTPEKPMSAKDKAYVMNYATNAVDKGVMTPEQARSYYKATTGDDIDYTAPKSSYASGDLGIMQYLTDNGLSVDEARQAVGKMTPNEKIAFEQSKNDIMTGGQITRDNNQLQNNIVLEGYRQGGRVDLANLNAQNQQNIANLNAQNQLNNQQAMADHNAQIAEQKAQADFNRQMQLINYKNSLPTEKQKDIAATAKALNIPEEQLYQMGLASKQAEADLTRARQDLVNAQKELQQAQIKDLYGPANESRKYRETYNAEKGKADAKAEQARKDAEKMKPTVLKAIERAKDAALSGTGVGIVGGRLAGWGVNPSEKAGQNYADIQSANTQMNTYLRKELAGAGLTGTELNSAVEVQAYRYTIDPTDNETVILRKLDNFIVDHIDNNPSEVIDFMDL